ncbi:DUF4352 domain-containing protein [Chloroflexota bacterium]
MSSVITTKAKRLGKALYRTRMRHALLAIIILVMVSSAACSGEETLPLGESASDDAHAFQPLSAKIVDKVGETTPPEDHGYLIIEYWIGNNQGQQDISRDWSQQFQLEDAAGKDCELTSLSELTGQLWNTTLLPEQKESGKMAFITPEKSYEFRLAFQFPVSGTSAIYTFKADDKRIEMYITHVLEKLEQTESTKGIPVIGGILESLSRSSIRYLGEVLVPEEDIHDLLDHIKGLSDEERRDVIADYLLEYKEWD